jgi:hypothetical protein
MDTFHITATTNIVACSDRFGSNRVSIVRGDNIVKYWEPSERLTIKKIKEREPERFID